MAHIHSVYDNDTHFKINPYTRVIENTSEKVIIMQNDHNSERFTFEIPRYIDGHDMSLCNKVQVHFNNIKADKTETTKDVYTVDDLQISPDSEDVVICSWLISQNATKYAGALNFVLRYACLTDTVIDYQWYTDIHKGITVSESISNNETAATEYFDLLEQWKKELEEEFREEFSGGTGGTGADGYSPSASVTQTSTGATITITDESGTTTATITNGKDGAAGKDGVGIASVEQTTSSSADGGYNVMTVTLTDGTASTFRVRNGSGGSESAATIPDYWQTALDNGVEAINTAMLEAGYNKSAFLFYTDAHWNYGSQMSPALLKYLYQKTGMNKTFFGGDIVNNEADDYDTMAYLWDWRNQLKDLPNHHSVVGNHDDGNTTNNLFDEKYVYGYLLAAEETPDIVPGDAGLYYYIDSPSEKTRYLFLDTAFQTVLYDAAQAQFVVDALKSAPAGWHIIAISHIWYNTDYDQNPPTVGSISYAGTMLLNLFDKYNARGSGSLSIAASSTDSTSTTVAYDFTSCGGKVEFCIGGHTHWDYDGASTGGIPVILCETDSQNVRSGLGYELGTTTEASVNGIVANYETGEISVIRIGRGSSRVINGSDSDNPEEEEPETPAGYTNVLKTAIDTDGSLYNGGKGYKDNTRINSSFADTAATSWYTTGYIAAKPGDVIRFKNAEFYDISADGGSTSRTSLYAYDSSFTVITSSFYDINNPPSAVCSPVYGDNGDVIQMTVPTSWGSDIAYIRFVFGYLDENSIITINEEIA